jgi:hypothetical protein
MLPRKQKEKLRSNPRKVHPIYPFFKKRSFQLSEKRKIRSIEAEEKAKAFIKQRHARVERIFFRKMFPEENTWVLQGELEFKRAYFFATVRTFEMQVNMNTCEVTSYEEAHLRNPKEQQTDRRS